MPQNLSAIIEVQTGGTEQRLEKLRQSIVRLQAVAVQAGAGTEKFNKAIQAIKNRSAEIGTIEKFNQSIGQNVPAATGRATQALTNFNRVVQDAPFGVLGIANNIDPLVQSFISLKNQTGSTGAALKAMAGTLVGPAGVLFAFSALSTAAIVLVQKYGSLEAGISALLGKFDALADANRKIEQSFAEAQGQAAGEIAQLNALVKIANDESKSRKQRQEALDQLNKEYDEYLPNLTLETIGSEKAKKAIDELSKSLIRQAQIKGLQELISKETQKQFEASSKSILEYATTWQKIQGFLNLATTRNAGAVIGNLAGNQKKDLDNAGIAIKRYTDELLKLIDVDTKVQSETLTGGGKKPKPFDFQKYLEDIIKRFEFKATEGSMRIQATPNIEVLTSGIEIKDGARKLNTMIEQHVDTSLALEGAIQPSVKVNPIPELNTTNLEKLSSEIARIITTGIGDAAETFGQGIGEALASGTNLIQAAGRSIIGALSELIIAMGKAIVRAGVAALGIKKILEVSGILGNPIGLIAAGVAAIAIGSAIKASIPKFAEGGIVTGPTLAMVGEGGQPEVVLPLSKLNTLFKGSDDVGEKIIARISGDDLEFLRVRVQKRQNRNF